MEMVRSFLSSGLAVMVFSAFFFALTDMVIKFISPLIGVFEIAFFRFLIGGVILLAIMLPRGISLRGNRTSILLVRGFSGTLTFLCLLKSIAMIPLANAMVLFYTFPVFATFFSFVFLREPVARREIILIAVGLIGIYVLLEPGSFLYNRGDIFGLLAGCFAGFAVALIRKLQETNNVLIIYFYYCLVGGIVSFPFFLKDFGMPSLQHLLLLILLGFIFLIAQLLMNQGFKFCKASEGSVILMLELIFTGIAGVVIFEEPLSPGFLVGALLILGSGVGLNLIHRRFRPSTVSRNDEKLSSRLP